MKKLITFTVLCSFASLTHANSLDTLLGRAGIIGDQANNFKQGISSLLRGNNNRTSVSPSENYTLGECIEIVEKAKAKQIEAGEVSIKSGYLTREIYSRDLEGSYTQFFKSTRLKSNFGNSLKRGLSNDTSIRFNSYAPIPQSFYQCNQYMDISSVDIVNFQGKECRKVVLTIKGVEVESKNLIKHDISNYFCVGDNTSSIDYLDHENQVIKEIKEQEETYDSPEY